MDETLNPCRVNWSSISGFRSHALAVDLIWDLLSDSAQLDARYPRVMTGLGEAGVNHSNEPSTVSNYFSCFHVRNLCSEREESL